MIANITKSLNEGDKKTMKNNNMELRKDCCKSCRCDGAFCVYRFELTEDVGSEFVKDGLIYTKSCQYFELD